MKQLNGLSVLVTGATGYLGSRVCEILATSEKAKVKGIGRNLDRVAFLRDSGVELISADIQNENDMRSLLVDVNVVIHCAVVFNVDPETAQKINVDATESLVRLSGEAKVSRFVHVSTVGACDMRNLDTVDESAPLAVNHSSLYPSTKAQAEVRAREAAEKYGVELSIVRPSMIFGPGHGLWSSGMFTMVQSGKPVLLGDGSGYFNPIYLDDVVEAIKLCATHPNAVGEVFNISAGITTWREFMGHYATLSGKELKNVPIFVAKLMAFANKIPGVKTPIDSGFIEMATSRKVFPTTKAKEKIGWEPKVTYEDGMKRTLEWLQREFM